MARSSAMISYIRLGWIWIDTRFFFGCRGSRVFVRARNAGRWATSAPVSQPDPNFHRVKFCPHQEERKKEPPEERGIIPCCRSYRACHRMSLSYPAKCRFAGVGSLGHNSRGKRTALLAFKLTPLVFS